MTQKEPSVILKIVWVNFRTSCQIRVRKLDHLSTKMPMDVERTLQTYMSNGGYKNTYRMSSDIVNVTKHYRGLQVKFELFIFNDGTQRKLICLQGVIPVPYRGQNYNIPVALWVLDTYPLHAPMCFRVPYSRHANQSLQKCGFPGKGLSALPSWVETNPTLTFWDLFRLANTFVTRRI